MGRFQWETPRDLRRAQDREEEKAEGLRRLRKVEQEQQPLFPWQEPGFGLPGGPGSPFEGALGAVGIEPGMGLAPEQVGEPRMPEVPELEPRTFPGMGAEFFRGLGEMAEYGRRQVKRHVIEPVVPEFEVTIPKEVVGAVAAGTPLLREAQQVGVFLGKEAPPVTITSELVEEAASWVLDPINAAFFIGPEFKAVGAAVKIANRIRKTKNVPAFVKAAMRVARSEAGGMAARDLEKAAVERFGVLADPPEGPSYLLRGGKFVDLKGEHAKVSEVFPTPHPDTTMDPLSNMTMGQVKQAAEFREATGAVRIHRSPATSATPGDLVVDLYGIPTDAQRKAILRASEMSPEVTIEAFTKEGLARQ
ncbi:hypothetical protein LCGC14_0969020, partial [marine sediment metagenome]